MEHEHKEGLLFWSLQRKISSLIASTEGLLFDLLFDKPECWCPDQPSHTTPYISVRENQTSPLGAQNSSTAITTGVSFSASISQPGTPHTATREEKTKPVDAWNPSTPITTGAGLSASTPILFCQRRKRTHLASQDPRRASNSLGRASGQAHPPHSVLQKTETHASCLSGPKIRCGEPERMRIHTALKQKKSHDMCCSSEVYQDICYEFIV